MDWLDSVFKQREYRMAYYKDILVLLVNRDILLSGFDDTLKFPAYSTELDKLTTSKILVSVED